MHRLTLDVVIVLVVFILFGQIVLGQHIRATYVLRRVLTGCLTVDPSNRWTMEQVTPIVCPHTGTIDDDAVS